MKTHLHDRTLWFDGTNEVEADKIINFILMNKRCSVSTTHISPEIRKYNQLVAKDEQITVKTDNAQFNFDWNIPPEYLTLDVYEYLIDKLDKEIIKRGWDDGTPEVVARCSRITTELKTYKRKGLIPLLRVLIYVINTLEQKQCIWGVGRGSSVSSYVLYLIGVHDIDSVRYEIDFTDFIGD